MLRGEVWWASLPVPRGPEPGYRRPVVIVQSDEFNKSNISTVLVAAISSNVRLSEAPGNVFLKRRESGLSKDSIINVSQLLTLDRRYLTGKIGKLSSKCLMELDEGLRLVLSI